MYLRRASIANDSNAFIAQVNTMTPVCRMEPVAFKALYPCQFGRIVRCVERTSSRHENPSVFYTPCPIIPLDFDSIQFRTRVPFGRHNFSIENDVLIEAVLPGQILPVLFKSRLIDMCTRPVGVQLGGQAVPVSWYVGGATLDITLVFSYHRILNKQLTGYEFAYALYT